ncbi:hypothetical protein [Lysobacter enzymogenes]|uniref:hypothetical protein n=1 Tax=Lysobacter enzymogenes TaxID=69 RepID=UPI00089BDA47|nr:hypothetical protein [Lysobacter enzymogenes]SDW93567.1 hypothetical protein SAMN05421681_103271 [Lysobacter enzymogenes]SDY08342.1 hypothetical protein SAMN05421681_110189 [Lysobacter enzymogenes]
MNDRSKLHHFWWRARLVRYLIRYNYYGRLDLRKAWVASGGEAWTDYYDSETHPHDAVIEDLSYA